MQLNGFLNRKGQGMLEGKDYSADDMIVLIVCSFLD